MRTTSALHALVAVITLLAFGLRVFHLAGQSLWYDEGFSVYLARMSLDQITARTAADIQPPLYYYLLHLWMLAFGQGEFAVRFLSVICSAMTVPVMFHIARRLTGARAGAIAALLLAVSPFHIWYGQETRMYALVTLLGLISSYLLLRALSAGRATASVVKRSGPAATTLWLLYALTNIAAVYSHYYAFFLVAFQLIFLVLWWLANGRPRRPLLAGLAATAATVIAYLPWLGAALNRYAVDESYWQGALSLDFIRKTLLAFSAGLTVVEGQAQIITAGYLVLLAIGLLVLGFRQRRLTAEGTDAAGSQDGRLPSLQALLFLVLYIAVPFMLLYALSALRPKFNPRYLMLASPPFIMLIAAGIAGLWEMRRTAARLAAAAGLAYVLATSAYALANNYGNRVYVRDDVRSVASTIAAGRQPGEAVVLVSGHMFPVFDYYGLQEPVYRIPDQETLSTRAVVDYSIIDTLNDIASQHPGVWLVLWQDNVVDPNGVLTGLLDSQAEPLSQDQGFWGINLRHYRLPPGTAFVAPQITAPVQVNFGNLITLLGYDPAELAVASGQPLTMTLFWQAQQPLSEDYWLSLRLVDAVGTVFARIDKRPATYIYPTTRWVTGTVIPGPAILPVLAGAPPGDYALQASLFTPANGATLDVLDANGLPSGAVATIATVHIGAPDAAPPVQSLGLDKVLRLPMGGGLSLVATNLTDRTVRQGEPLQFDIAWSNSAAPLQDYRLKLRLSSPDGAVLQETIVPLTGSDYATTRWPAGSLLRAGYSLTAPAGAPPEIVVEAALVDPAGATIAPLQPIARLSVTPVTRSSTAPAMAHVQMANFGNVASLLGYDCPSSARAGQPLDMVLYWRAGDGAPTARPYSVFVHLLDARQNIYGQSDGQPANGSRPTTGWLPGEVISDPHRLTVQAGAPPGDYMLEIGLYDPLTGQRLMAQLPNGTQADHVILETQVRVER